jgi:hypothetical protein
MYTYDFHAESNFKQDSFAPGNLVYIKETTEMVHVERSFVWA